MISHHHQSEISFWLMVVIGVAILGAGIGLASAAVGNVQTYLNQPACGCGGVVTLSVPLVLGGIAGLLLAGWAAVAAFILVKQTRRFIGGLNVISTTRAYWVINDRRAVAFTAGLLQPIIYLSTGLLAHLTVVERQAVVRHERYHQQRFDPLRIAITETLQRVFRWLPGMTALYRHWRLTRELAADASSATEPERLALGRSLVKLLEQPLMTTAISAFSATEERVRQLLQPVTVVPRRQWLVPIAAAFVVIAAIATLAIHSHAVEARTVGNDYICPLTRQCIEQQIKKQSIEPVRVICAPLSPAGSDCFIIGN